LELAAMWFWLILMYSAAAAANMFIEFVLTSSAQIQAIG